MTWPATNFIGRTLTQRTLIAAVLMLISTVSHAQSETTDVPAGFVLWEAACLEAAADRLERELGDQELVWENMGSYEGHSMYLVLRGRTPMAELHETESDVHIIVRGKATYVMGGELVDKELLPRKQQRGTSIRGGTSRPVASGDVIFVAPNIAHHQIIAPGESYIYILIKLDEEPDE